MKITTVGIDIAKSVFHVVAVNKMGALVKKKQLKRNELLAFIAQLEPCRIALEAWGTPNVELRGAPLLARPSRMQSRLDAT